MTGEETKRSIPPHAVSGAFVFLLLGVFAVSCLAMVLFGVRAYRESVARGQERSEERILSAYVRSMVRSLDAEGAAGTEEFPGVSGNILTLREEYDEAYLTRIYVYQGQMYEWFSEETAEFEPDKGEKVCPAQELSAALSGNILTLEMRTEKGKTIRVQQVLRCGETD